MNRFINKLFIVIAFHLSLTAGAQPIRLDEAVAATKRNEQQRLVKMVNTNLALPISEEAELPWESAFWAMELMRYTPAGIGEKASAAFKYFSQAEYSFQRAFLEWLFALHPVKYNKQVQVLLNQTKEPRIFALCCAYLSKSSKTFSSLFLLNTLKKKFTKVEIDNSPLLQYLSVLYSPKKEKLVNPEFIFSPGFLPNQPVLYSLQRPGRNVPGMLIIRRANGSFVNLEDGKLFSVPQLARSLSSLPFYVSLGNTPQGIFLFTGFDISKSIAIGPTENLQLQMPFETTPGKFLRDSTVTDTVWSFALYNRLLPAAFRQNGYSTHPFYETYIASAAGRDEIIAHGTTVNPEYYKNTSYHPFTPTVGCLCTKEFWNYQSGERTFSDQQLLVDVLKKEKISAGYLVVVETGKAGTPFTIEELRSIIPR